MSHLTEEQLILYYYGEAEAPDVTGHLDGCISCRALYGSLQRTLNLVESSPVPERDGQYGSRLWLRIEPELRRAGGATRLSRLASLLRAPSGTEARRWAAAAVAFTILLGAAFLMGRFYPVRRAAPPAIAADTQLRERVLLVAVGDYLERSQIMLLELSNAAPAPVTDISAQQARAEELASETRLYRQTAAYAGDAGMTALLDELERVMVEITHEPAQLPTAGLERLRERLKSEGIVFKIRVLGSSMRRAEQPAEPAERQKL